MKKQMTRALAVSLSAVMAFSNAASLLANENAANPDTSSAIKATVSKDNGLASAKLDQAKGSLNSIAADEQVKFIVELESKSVLEAKPERKTVQEYLNTQIGQKYQAKLEAEQEKAVKSVYSLKKNNVNVERTYSVVLNGFSVSAPYSMKEELEAIDGVKSVTVARKYEYADPTEGYTQAIHTSGEMMDSDRVNAEGYTGKGTVTAILDTGLDVAHEAFQADPADPAWDQDTVAGFVSNLELQADADAGDLYKSAKVPFAYDYADGDTEVLGPENHGTHVAGSVGANGSNLTGVAPDTQIVVMKVFSDTESGASDDDIFAALEDAVLLGVDSVNMSLGSACGFSSDSEADAVYQRVQEAGINLMVSAGNDTDSVYNNNLGTDLAKVDEPDNSIVGSPSTYSAAMSVASVNENKVFSSYILASDGTHIEFHDPNAGADLEFSKALDGQELEYVTIPGFGTESDFASAGDLTGKIALVSRGSITFGEKEANAKNAGAVGCIVYDNVEGDIPNMAVNGELPCIAITKANGQLLKSLEDKTLSISADYQEYVVTDTCGLMSDFSSLGVTPDLVLKPEITAPGGNVYSTLPGDTYGNMSGTSMAAPHMAGAAAVMKQYVNEEFEDLDNNEKQSLINTLLMNTAIPVKDEYGVEYTPRKQGSGLANIYNAVHTGAYVTVEGSDLPKAELGDSAEGYFSKTFTLTVHNFSDTEASYNLSAIALTAQEEEAEGYYDTYLSISNYQRILPEEEFEALFSSDSITVAPGEEVSVDVRLRLTKAGEEALSDFTNGTFLDGFIVLEDASDEGIDLSVPYVGFYGDWGSASIFDDSMYDEEEASVFESSMAVLDISTWNGYYLGQNLFADEDIIDADKIAVASKSLGYSRVYSMLGLLRAPETLDYSIVSEDGTEYYSSTTTHPVKSFYYSGGGFINYEMGPEEYGWSPVYEDEEGYANYVPDGQYEYKITGTVAGTDSAAGTQEESFPITIDNEAPAVVSTKYFEEDGVPYLAITVSDNHYLMAMQLISADEEDAYSDAVIIDEDKAGASTTMVFDMSDLQAQEVETLKVYLCDYATNEFISDEISTIADEVQPKTIRINNRDIWLTGSQTFEIEAYCTPMNCAPTDITWTSSDESIVSVKGLDKTRDDYGTTMYAAEITTYGIEGTAEITATTSNGKSDTVTVTVSNARNDWPEDNTITEDGYYNIPASLNAEVKISGDAKNVTLIGNEANTADNPYSNLRITSSVEGLNLTIKDINDKQTEGVNWLTLTGPDNVLTILGSNSVDASEGSSYSKYSKALIYVPQGTDLTIEGTGSLDLATQICGYGAAIGSNAGGNAGTITVNSSVLNLTVNGAGAGIGGGSNGSVEKVTINGGTINIDIPLCEASYSTNLTYTGAGIGTGDQTSSSKGVPEIEINGGTISGQSWTSAPIIGTSYAGYTTSAGPKITINGGNITAVSNVISSSSASTNYTTAAIGSGESVAGATNITINGGNVTAINHGIGAAIGSAVNTGEANVTIKGGTVTAIQDGTNSSYTSPAIGAAKYASSSSYKGTVYIDAGSVKASSVTTDAIKSSDGAVFSTEPEEVFEVIIPAQPGTVKVDGKDWKVDGAHPEDTNVYLWLTEGTHIVNVDDKSFYVTFAKDGSISVRQFWTVSTDLEHLSLEGSELAFVDEDYTAALKASAAEGYSLPASITVEVSGEPVEFTYDSETGEITIAKENLTGPVSISAKAKASANKGDLADLIAGAKDLDESNYTPSTWSAFQEALAVAEEVYDDETAGQDVVDEALRNLAIAMYSLKERADLSELEAAIAEADKTVRTDYLDEGWDEFAKALDNAKAAAADPEISQETADACIRALKEAKDALIKRADKTNLREAIDEAEHFFEHSFDEKIWNKSGIDAAYEQALNVYLNTQVRQDAVDKAERDLRAAIARLSEKADKRELESLIASALEIKENGVEYTPETWSEFEEALKEAQRVDKESNNQSEIDAAASRLAAAISSLKVLVHTEELEAEIAKAKALNKDDWTEESWSVLEDALAKAEKALEDKFSQESVDKAAAELKAAIDALEKAPEPIDTKDLEDLIAKAKGLNKDDWTEESWKDLEDTLAKAEKALDDKVSQDEVNKAAEDLKAAIDALEKAPEPVDVKDLEDLIAKAKDLNKDDWTEESWKNLEKALTKAEKALDDKVSQDEVDKAADDLKAAIDALEKAKAPVDTKALEDLLETAKGYTPDGWTEESWNSFVDALAKAEKALQSDASQEKVDAAAEALKKAIDGLEKADQKNPVVSTQTVYRAYNPNDGDHLYTTNYLEWRHAIEAGWNSEGIAWKSPTTSARPVYRLYDRNSGEHHYTMDEHEKSVLIMVYGWMDEGIGWYSDEAESVDVYRLYNPNATGAGRHHYTISEHEYKTLISLGWKDEAVGFHAALD